MKGLRKISQFLLAMMMSISLCSLWAFADDSYAWTGDENTISVSDNVITLSGDGKLTLNSNITANIVINGNYSIEVDLNGYTLTGKGNDSVISVTSAILTLSDSSESGNGTITGGNAINGGGICVTEGTLTMMGGTISNCSASQYGGGVYLGCTNNGNGSTFTMAGGTITQCSASAKYSGGGVYADHSSFIMTGGTIDQCTGVRGAGVVINDGYMLLDEGTIQNCKASDHGGGIYIYDSYDQGLYINSGSISGCTATNKGGAIRACSGTTVSITGGTISGNSASYGGGIYADGSTIKMTGGTISGNRATIGGGLYAAVQTGDINKTGEATISATGGILANNTATDSASDVYSASTCILVLSGLNENEKYDVTGCTITGWYQDENDSRYAFSSNITDEVTSLDTNEHFLIAAHGLTATVTYTDGVDDEEVFEDEVYTESIGSAVPSFSGSLSRTGYTFIGWQVNDTDTIVTDVSDMIVEGDIVFTAIWQKQEVLSAVLDEDSDENNEIDTNENEDTTEDVTEEESNEETSVTETSDQYNIALYLGLGLVSLYGINIIEKKRKLS